MWVSLLALSGLWETMAKPHYLKSRQAENCKVLLCPHGDGAPLQ